jgi:hypothetical protein
MIGEILWNFKQKNIHDGYQVKLMIQFDCIWKRVWKSSPIAIVCQFNTNAAALQKLNIPHTAFEEKLHFCSFHKLSISTFVSFAENFEM